MKRTPARCTSHVPPVLCTHLRPLPQCSLLLRPDGSPHQGKHRAHRTVFRVGKVIWRWEDHLLG